jgi:regulatory protein YycH of two-component signal transduction system YycFG
MEGMAIINMEEYLKFREWKNSDKSTDYRAMYKRATEIIQDVQNLINRTCEPGAMFMLGTAGDPQNVIRTLSMNAHKTVMKSGLVNVHESDKGVFKFQE